MFNDEVNVYKITKVISPVLYEMFRKNKKEMIHFDKLKPCNVDQTDRV